MSSCGMKTIQLLLIQRRGLFQLQEFLNIRIKEYHHVSLAKIA